MTRQEKNALGKVNAILHVVQITLMSALGILNAYAPSQTRLIAVLQYIDEVLDAIIMAHPIPLPTEAIVQTEAMGVMETDFHHIAQATRQMDIPVLPNFRIVDESKDAASGDEIVIKNDQSRYLNADPDCPRTM